MTPGEKMLATALRDLCGWHVGMRVEAGDHDDWEWSRHTWGDGESSKHFLPVLDSPANWGHWIAWLVHKVDPAEVDICGGGSGWSACVSPCATCEPERLPDALLRAYMEHCEEQGTDQEQPSSVLAWWKEHGQ